jgi:DNA-binding MarR family transcriptional regulator
LLLVGLTPAGRMLIGELLPIEIKCTEKTLSALNARERKLLYELLGRLAGS